MEGRYVSTMLDVGGYDEEQWLERMDQPKGRSVLLFEQQSLAAVKVYGWVPR